MDIYTARKRIKLILLFAAVLIGFGSLWYSGDLTAKLQEEERKKIKLWAEAVKEIQEIPIDGKVSLTLYKIIEENKTIPVILTDEQDNIITHMNLGIKASKKPGQLQKTLREMKEEHKAIVIDFDEGKKNYVYYKDSSLLTKLSYYPYVQLGLITLFIAVSYMAFKNSQQAEENKIWAGISKETAHQLGTPLSSLLAWVEYMKLKNADSEMLTEVEKDVNRLELITERFSKIGSEPELTSTNVQEVIQETVSYLKVRTSRQVEFQIIKDSPGELKAPINKPLFAWVIENLCKNSIDAMDSQGLISINTGRKKNAVIIDISDTGKGIPSKMQKSVFKAGFTTKKRGWGLGLSLTKRIIEIYHPGKIFIKESEPGKGTTFRIELYDDRKQPKFKSARFLS